MSAPATLRDAFAAAREVADAVLFEGYVLYPYRASSAKNRLRWQFGVLVPPGWTEAAGERAGQRTECLLEPRRAAELVAEVRFLRVVRRTVLDARGAEVAELADGEQVWVPWDEGAADSVEARVPLRELLEEEGALVGFTRPGGEEREALPGGGTLVRRAAPLSGQVRLTAREVPGPFGALRLTVTVANTSTEQATSGGRPDALPHSLVGVHVLLGVPGGRFVSMTDPPEWAAPAARECRNEGAWPVLSGGEGRRDVLLSSPIILADHPSLAPESPGAMYDGTEIDEMLALRTATLTEEEKREARGTDARAADVVEMIDALPPQMAERLHGVVRDMRGGASGAADTTGVPVFAEPPTLPSGFGHPWWDPSQDPEAAGEAHTAVVDGRVLGEGSRVRLRLSARRRTDAQDMFLDGRSATVEAVLPDIDGETHLAVVVDDDPGIDLRRAAGRFWYFRPDELEPLDGPSDGPREGS